MKLINRIMANEEAFHLVLAAIIGVIGGLVNLAFLKLVALIQWIVFQKSGDSAVLAQDLSAFLRILVPTLGGILAGMVLLLRSHLSGIQKPTNVLEVVAVGDGRIGMRSTLVNAWSSLLSIGTGASIGREGAITQLTATFASKWGQFHQWQPYRLRLMVACGAAAGLAAAYNAPIAGALFAALVLVGNFSMNLFAPLVMASVVATMVSRFWFGIEPWYELPESIDYGQAARLSQMGWFLILGIISGAGGAFFLKSIQNAQSATDKYAWPSWAKLGLAGLVVGLIALVFPGVWGNGYEITNQILHADSSETGFTGLIQGSVLSDLQAWQISVVVLAGLLVAKFVATVCTVGAGTVGGVFTPTLFLGAGLGAAFGQALGLFDFADETPTVAFALVGMGSVLAATTRSPLLAMILIFEISLKYELMPPLMIGCVVATLVSQKLHKASVYSAPLHRRGLVVDQESRRMGSATDRCIGDVMVGPTSPIKETASLPEISEIFLRSPRNYLPVLSVDKRLVGVISLQDLKAHLNAGDELRAVIALDLMRPPETFLTPNRRLMEALPEIMGSEMEMIPVVNSNREMRLVGSVSRSETLGLMSEAIARSGEENTI
jgi:CIC family chloride channel protein|tara:strand:+ start:379 stop:2196 length:1818 start_codon:yes stop_codon:yes gene_type:complete